MSNPRKSEKRSSAVLIDLENYFFGSKGLLGTEQARQFLGRVVDIIQDSNYCVAMAPAWVMAHYISLLHEFSIPISVVQPGPNAADLALLEQARHLASIGYTHFVVLSGDHIFTELCRAYPTTVIVRNSKALSHALRDSAETVITDGDL